ncbi:MAG: lysophospholipid acyltransferase family protein [candidate division WOR-3 bacterium]|nr:MAG: lysophospholipid acyltransferase family protein [candidate division WOR-3 bacterium]
MPGLRSPITWLMPLGTALQFFVPRWVVVVVAKLAGHLVYRLDRLRRQALQDNLRRILSPEVPERLVRRAARKTFTNLLMNYFDLIRGPVMKGRVVDLVEHDSTRLDRILGRDGRVLMVTGHIGNWDLAGVFLTALGYPLSAVVEPVPAGWTETFDRYRRLTNMKTIPIPDRESIHRAIRDGRILTLVADRAITGRGVRCPSFGAHRLFPRGPAAYALRFGLTVVIGYLVFQNLPGRPPYLGIAEPLPYQPTGDLEHDIAELTKAIAARLNQVIARHPDQWLVFDPRWQ